MRRPARHAGIIALMVIVLWWAYDHLALTIPSKTIDHFIPEAIAGFELPSFELDYGKKSPYNESKVALLIENRPDGKLAPLILHMMSVVPPEWRFRFMGSNDSVNLVNNSAAIRRQVEVGKLDITYIPHNMSVAGQEHISQFLTNLWVYDQLLAPAEWLLVYQTDSAYGTMEHANFAENDLGIMCANSLDNLDNWLDFDWVGAPWSLNHRYNGNGGLSLRKVSSIVKVLEHQRRVNGSEPEDVWLTERLAHLPGTKVSNGTEALKFSGEALYVEHPMGYHTGGSGAILNGGIWGTLEKRRALFEYCPEVKMTLEMDIESFMPHFCNTEW